MVVDRTLGVLHFIGDAVHVEPVIAEVDDHGPRDLKNSSLSISDFQLFWAKNIHIDIF